MRTPKIFAGKWPITETEMWDEDALDLVEPAHIGFDSAGGGSFRMIAIQAEIDLYDGPGVGRAMEKLSPFFKRTLS